MQSPLPESDSECYTDATTSFSQSGDDLNLDEDLNMDISLEQEEMPDKNVGYSKDVVGCKCWAGRSPYTMWKRALKSNNIWRGYYLGDIWDRVPAGIFLFHKIVLLY